MKKFVFALKDIHTNSRIIQENEVGIIKEEDSLYYIINFVVSNTDEIINKSDVEIFKPNETGDGFSFKVCNVCNKLLNTSLFQKNQNGKGNRIVRRPSCEICRKNIDGIPISSQDKKKWEEKKPNFEIFECPICKKRTIPGLTSKVVLDHNHKTGKARGWICDSCNTGLGRFQDNIILLNEAIKYLNNEI